LNRRALGRATAGPARFEETVSCQAEPSSAPPIPTFRSAAEKHQHSSSRLLRTSHSSEIAERIRTAPCNADNTRHDELPYHPRVLPCGVQSVRGRIEHIGCQTGTWSVFFSSWSASLHWIIERLVFTSHSRRLCDRFRSDNHVSLNRVSRCR
jgi:hypothetical protein